MFGNIPKPLIILFYVGVGLALGLAVYFFSLRARNWERGAKERRLGMWGRRAKEFLRGVTMASVLEDRVAGRAPRHDLLRVLRCCSWARPPWSWTTCCPTT